MVGPGPEPQRLADVMSSAWVAFARTGNPNVKGLPRWPAYDLKRRATMILNFESHVRDDPYRDIRLLLIR
jgi:para-nitrobenzyl esterase